MDNRLHYTTSRRWHIEMVKCPLKPVYNVANIKNVGRITQFYCTDVTFVLFSPFLSRERSKLLKHDGKYVCDNRIFFVVASNQKRSYEASAVDLEIWATNSDTDIFSQSYTEYWKLVQDGRGGLKPHCQQLTSNALILPSSFEKQDSLYTNRYGELITNAITKQQSRMRESPKSLVFVGIQREMLDNLQTLNSSPILLMCHVMRLWLFKQEISFVYVLG